MQALWRKTAYLFWQHPVLWLPVLCADACCFWLKQFRTIAIAYAILWFGPHESVFSDRPAVPHPGSEAYIANLGISAPMFWIGNLAFLYFYVVALRATAALVNAVEDSRPLNWQEICRKAFQEPRTSILLSAKVVLLGFAITLLATTPFLFKLRPESLSPNSFILATSILEAALVALLIVPSGLKMIWPAQSSLPTTADKRNARFLAICAVIASTLVGESIAFVERPIYADLYPQVLRAFLEMCASLIAALPYMPLFIALSLIALSMPPQPPVIEATCDAPAQS